jgi:hypothetical protein
MPGDRLSLGVELQQLLRHVAHRLLDARLGLLPRRAAEAVERGAAAAGEFLNEVEPLDGHEELVVAVIAKLEKFLDIDLLEADELTDAVIDVDDQVADL